MAKKGLLEFTVGLFVIAGIGALLMLALQVSNLGAIGESSTYNLTARFENIGGLKVRSAVRVSGVTVGRVTEIEFDQEELNALVTLAINSQYYNLPKDTSASILTSGLLGDQYVGLEPGGEDDPLVDGDAIELTQSALVIEKLVGQFLVSKATEE